MTDTLSHDQVQAALVMLQSHWANQSLPDSVRDTWRRKLATLRCGEFQPAFDAWLDGPRCRFRPEPGELMDIVLARRPRAVPPNDINAPKRTAPDHETFEQQVTRWKSDTFGDEVPTRGDEWIEKIRERNHLKTAYRKEGSK